MKDERTKQFPYSFHVATDQHGFVLGTIVTPGNIHDSHMLQPLVEKVIEKVNKPLAVAADAAPSLFQFKLLNFSKRSDKRYRDFISRYLLSTI